jgi:transcriptional regulator with XRE-family HTH domain
MAERRVRGEFERRLRAVIPTAVHETRRAIGWSQDELARRSGVAQSKISRLEAGAIDRLTLEDGARILDALGIQTSLAAKQPFIDRTPLQHDAAHARCIGHVARQLGRLGWQVRTELEVVDGSARGWADVIALDSTRRLLVIEAKAAVPDVGAAQRQLAWYARMAPSAVRPLGWRAASVTGALLLLATDENAELIRRNAALVRQAFPSSAAVLAAWLEVGSDRLPPAIALIDPRSRRGQWLQRAATEGRGPTLRYRNYAEFMSRVRAA